MAKTKEPKTSKKSEVKSLSSVKNASVTKPSQTPIAKSKQIAKETAAKVNGHSKKPAPIKKAATPSSSDDDSDASASESESDSESEVEVPKAVANGKVSGKVNGKTNGKVATESSSDEESDSDESDSSDESSDADSSGDEKVVAPVAAKDDSDSSDSSEEEEDSDEESDEEEAPAAKIAKAADAEKTNGALKAVKTETKAKAKAESDDDDSSDSSASSDSDEEEDSDSDDSDDSSEDEEEAPSKKRKAEDETAAPTKKSKVEVEAVDESGPKNLFVGNLSWNVDDEWLYREFEEFGEISGARVVTDKATGRSKGFGYVDFNTAANCAAALKAKKGTMIDGREANVDFSTPRDNNAPRERANDRAAKFGDSTNPPSDTLFLGNLSFGADENMIGEAFGEHATVVNIRLPTDQETGNPKGFGYVTFGSIEDCKTAYDAMLGAEIDGRPLRLDYATPRPDNGGSRGGRGGGRGGRGGFDRGGRGGGRGGFASRGGGRGGARGGRSGSTNRGGFGDFQGKKQTFA